MKKIVSILFVMMMVAAQSVMAEVLLKPHVLASKTAGEYEKVVSDTRNALTSAGFDIAGEHVPYKGTIIFVVTNDALKKNAAASKHGGYGVAQRVAVSKVGNEIQVVYTNPVYMANVYRMKDNLNGVRQQLEAALGKVSDFGAEGLTAEDLRDYQYKIFMPYFDDPFELASLASHEAAVAAVEKGLKAGWGGTSKVYRIDIPGKQEVVFGVGLTRDCSSDAMIMGAIDFGDIKAATHLPYELMVSGKEVLALHAKFRIAQSFPDLSMMGSNSFMSIMCSPGDIESALEAVVKGEQKDSDW